MNILIWQYARDEQHIIMLSDDDINYYNIGFASTRVAVFFPSRHVRFPSFGRLSFLWRREIVKHVQIHFFAFRRLSLIARFVHSDETCVSFTIVKYIHLVPYLGARKAWAYHLAWVYLNFLGRKRITSRWQIGFPYLKTTLNNIMVLLFFNCSG